MKFQLRAGETVKWKGETDGRTWTVWPVVDDGSPLTDDELTERTYEFRKSLGITGVAPGANRFAVSRTSEKAVDAWLRSHGIPLTFRDIAGEKPA